jgi:MFS family permease
MNERSPLIVANLYSTSYLANPLLSSAHDSPVVIDNPLLTISEDLPSVSDDGDDSQPSFSGLLFFKSLYFLNGLSASTWGRFGVIYYNSVKHLSPEQIGILQGAIPLFGLVTMPFWGYIADLVRSRKCVYLFCKVLGTISLLSLSLSSVDTFPLILLCVSGMAIFKASGVLDAHTLDFLGKKHRTMYGTIRMWAAISWGIGAVIMGWITDSFGFRWNFGLYGGMMILMLVIMAYGLPARSKSEQVRYDRSALGHTQRRPRTAVLVKALCRPTVLFWLLEVEAIGAGMCLVDSFLFVFLQNELNASTTLCGYAVGITVIFEL